VVKVGIAGASGYAGAELLRLCAGHPEFDVVVATAGGHEGDAVGEHTPSLAASYPSLRYAATTPGDLDGVDVAFLALPHGRSQGLVSDLLDRVGIIVDLAADFRLHDPLLYPEWYGEEHQAPELLGQFVTGLPELHREELVGARWIAVPGCYPTATLLALSPLVKSDLLAFQDDGTQPGGPAGLIVDAASGVSGAGRAPSDSLHFGTVDENFVAYGLLDHRHTAEMEQGLGTRVLFTPHLAPMVRGILATCYGRPSVGANGPVTTAAALDVLHQAYDDEIFVSVSDRSPSTKATTGSNRAHVTVRVDERTGWLISLCAIDNLIKGAAGQAIQCANISVGIAEDTGLPQAGLFP
jgi:N-acetyl-gamma-glutamyl-phosphate reductase